MHISFGTFLKLGCRKSAFRCGTKHISKSKCTKHSSLGAFWKLRCSKSVRRCGAKQHVEVKCAENRGDTEHFWTFRCRSAWQAQRIVHLVKSEQSMRVVWQFQKRWQAWDMCRGSGKGRSARDMFVRAVRRSER